MTDKTSSHSPAYHVACRQAEAYGIDLSLLLDNLKLSPYERMQRHDKALTGAIELRQAMLKVPTNHTN